MSDSTQQYILKQPAEASYYEEGLMAVEFEDISECLIITDEQFENTFVPLDIPSIEKQLEEIKDDLYGQVEYEAVVYGGQVEENAFEMHVKDAIYDALDQIKVLFGLENKETD